MLAREKEFTDYYRILQIHQDAEPEIVKSAYRRLAQMNHPDTNPDPQATLKMQLINKAYEIISDPVQRKSYHRLWVKHNQAPTPPPPRPAPRPAPEPHAAASQSLDAYFRALLQEDWTAAYNRLSRKDRSTFSLEDFCEWKVAVKALYQMGSYVIKPFRDFEKCVVNDTEYDRVHVFSVFITDRDTRSGHINEETYTKYVVYENGGWFVCLGYKQLKPIIYKLKYIASQAPSLDPFRVYADTLLKYDKLTGFFSRQGFLERTEQEVARSKRFRNPFCLLVMEASPLGCIPGIPATEYKQMCLLNVAVQLQKNVRDIDCCARISDNQLAVLLIESDSISAQKALRRLERTIRPSEGLDYRLNSSITPFRGETAEDTLLRAEHEARIRVVTGRDNVKRYYINLDDQQV